MKPENIDSIIIHCSATAEGKDYRAADIDRWHKAKGWQMIGYNFVVDLDGSIERGRPIAMDGAHCPGYNSHSIGICYIGGCEIDGKTPKDTRTDRQKVALANLVYSLMTHYPIVKVLGHRDTGANKACPCFDVRAEFPIAVKEEKK